ncbi:hypothetical protein E2C01_018571 [Portunus trituberculatus]|uniref:Uncharacterized protein n=1 Tax=Portunus trituberculatus TaxID=210409 RepID=A0A5B7DWT7_PORTR|nr:hypothetical protein [Portunus trituberculatus]
MEVQTGKCGDGEWEGGQRQLLAGQTGLTQEDLVDAESRDRPCTSKQLGPRAERGKTACRNRDGRLKYSRPTLAILPLARF